VTQLLSIVGAALILGAFAALQFRWTGPLGVWYLVANIVGSACLAVAAAIEALPAFIVLNTVWGLVAVRSLIVVLRGRGKPAGTLAGRDAAQRPDTPG
jgi:hypothetical protein